MDYNLTTIQQGMTDSFFRDKIVFFEKVDSTNTVAKQLAEQDSPSGTVVIADTQTGGRGRYSRIWYSPPQAGIWMSLITRPRLTPEQAVHMPEMIGQQLLPIFKAYGGGPYRVKLPNDILVNSKKLCGILCESSVLNDRLDYVVIGIGINVRQRQTDFPDSLADIATSLLIETGVVYNRIELIDDILHSLKKAIVM